MTENSKVLINLFWRCVLSGLMFIISQLKRFAGLLQETNILLPLLSVFGTVGFPVWQQATMFSFVLSGLQASKACQFHQCSKADKIETSLLSSPHKSQNTGSHCTLLFLSEEIGHEQVAFSWLHQVVLAPSMVYCKFSGAAVSGWALFFPSITLGPQRMLVPHQCSESGKADT